MALTRSFLTALGIEESKIGEIITAHTETFDGIKHERDELKKELESLRGASKELETVKKELATAKADAESNKGFKEKYETMEKEYGAYKTSVEQKETHTKKTEAFKKALKDAGISEKRFDVIVKCSGDDIDAIAFDDKGEMKDAENLKKKLGETWADFKVKTSTKGADTHTNPDGNGGSEDEDTQAAADRAKAFYAARYGSPEKN